METYWDEVAQIFVIAMLGAMSPGPSFAVILRSTLLSGRRSGWHAALGVLLADVILVILCLLGLGALLAHSPFLFFLLRYGGAGYLIYIGVQGLRNLPDQRKPIEASLQLADQHHYGALREGFTVALLNPYTVLFFFSIFSVLLDQGTPIPVQVLYGTLIIGTTFLWFMLLVTITSHRRITIHLARVQRVVSMLLSWVLILIALSLILSGLKELSEDAGSQTTKAPQVEHVDLD